MIMHIQSQREKWILVGNGGVMLRKTSRCHSLDFDFVSVGLSEPASLEGFYMEISREFKVIIWSFI